LPQAGVASQAPIELISGVVDVVPPIPPALCWPIDPLQQMQQEEAKVTVHGMPLFEA